MILVAGDQQNRMYVAARVYANTCDLAGVVDGDHIQCWKAGVRGNKRAQVNHGAPILPEECTWRTSGSRIAHDLLLRVHRKRVRTVRAVDGSKIVHLAVPQDRTVLVVTCQVSSSDNQ